jgi:hypothetical protein
VSTRHFLKILNILLIIIVLLASMTISAQGGTVGQTISTLNVRIGPGTRNAVVTKLPRLSEVVVEGRNEVGDWLLVHTVDGAARGWVATRYLILPDDFNLTGQPVLNEVIGETPNAAATPFGYGDTLPTETDPNVMIARLKSLPILPGINDHVREIFQHGQELGNRRNVFTKVGDSLSVIQPFLIGFGNGNYNLGSYGYLQDTINFFSVSPRAGANSSFDSPSIAAQSGFTSGGVLDPIWVDPRECSTGESPLLCEYSTYKPSVAIILFGSVDMQISDIVTFELYMQQIVSQTIDRGVIPVMNTFPSHPDFRWEESLKFNTVVINIAQKYNVPVINLWAATQPLPNFGVGPDKFHLSNDSDHIFSFDGSENQYGLTLRNLLTLQMLDTLRREALS